MRSFVLNPSHPSGQFVRTIRIEGREPRTVLFQVGGTVELDSREAEFMAPEIALGIIGLAGEKFPKPEQPELHRLDPREDGPDDKDDWHAPLESSKGWLVGRFCRSH